MTSKVSGLWRLKPGFIKHLLTWEAVDAGGQREGSVVS